MLEPNCEVVGAVADGRALLTAAKELRPDVAVLDIAMPLLNGLDAARQLKRLMPAVKVIFLTASEDPDLAAEAFRAGASGFLLMNSAACELFQAIYHDLVDTNMFNSIIPVAYRDYRKDTYFGPRPCRRFELHSWSRRVIIRRGPGYLLVPVVTRSYYYIAAHQ